MPRIEAATVAEHHAMRRAQVVSGAADVLRDNGVGGFTPAAVARRAGLARSSMYLYYPSTEALLGVGVAELLRRSVARMSDAVAAGGTPGQRIAAYLRAAVDDAAQGHGSLAELADLTMPEHCRQSVRALHDELLEPLRQALLDGGVEDAATMAVLVQGLVNSAVTAVRHGAPREHLVEATVDFVLRGLDVRDPQPFNSAAPSEGVLRK